MGCEKCARTIFAERATDAHFRYQETIISTGSESRIDFRARKRRVLAAFCEHPLGKLRVTKDEVFFTAPAGVEAIVEFTLI